MTANVREETFIRFPCHSALEYAATAIGHLSVAAHMGGATRYANTDMAVTALERALREAKSARREAKKAVRK